MIIIVVITIVIIIMLFVLVDEDQDNHETVKCGVSCDWIDQYGHGITCHKLDTGGLPGQVARKQLVNDTNNNYNNRKNHNNS